jgi:PAS domain S-box-containing protein
VLYGYTPAEFIGLLVTRLVHPDSHLPFDQFSPGIQPGDAFESPAVHVSKKGSLLNVEVRWTVFTYQDQSCRLGLVRDVSERVEAELLLRRKVEAINLSN